MERLRLDESAFRLALNQDAMATEKLAEGIRQFVIDAIALERQIDEIRVDLNPAERLRMMEITGRRTVPQIFIGGQHIGGSAELHALDAAGGLDPLLARAG